MATLERSDLQIEQSRSILERSFTIIEQVRQFHQRESKNILPVLSNEDIQAFNNIEHQLDEMYKKLDNWLENEGTKVDLFADINKTKELKEELLDLHKNSIDKLSKWIDNETYKKALKYKKNIEKIEREIALIKPSDLEEFEATLKWMIERGEIEELNLIYKIKNQLPYYSEQINNLIMIAINKIENRLSQKAVSEQTVYYKAFLLASPRLINMGRELEVSINLIKLSLNGNNNQNYDENAYVVAVKRDNIAEEINIALTASGFQFNGEYVASLPFDIDAGEETLPQKPTQKAIFRLTPLRAGRTTITAEIYRGEKFETTLKTKVEVVGYDKIDLLRKPIATKPRPVPQPDFIIRVQTIWDESGSVCKFHYQLKNFRLSSIFAKEKIYTSQSFSSSLLKQMQEEFKEAVESSAQNLPESRLISFGKNLFQRLIPFKLKKHYRRLISYTPKALLPTDRPFTLLILADQNTWIPWELLHDGEQFLSDRFIIGRWLWELNNTRPYEFPVGAIDIAYNKNVEQPEQWTQRLTPPGADPPLFLPNGRLSDLESSKAIRGLHLIHYSESSELAKPPNASVTLDHQANDAQYIEHQIRLIKVSLRHNRPLVSVSCLRSDCPKLTNLEQTWASAFMRAGCSAVIGSLWAVDPTVEAAFISDFYHRLWTGDSLGEAFHASRQARAVAPDWLAYVLFGDPMARPYRPVEGKGYAVVEPIGREIDDPLPPGVPVRFRLSLRRTPPVWHEERVIEVAENLTFENLQAYVKTFGLQVTPDSPITMSLAPTGNYLGWFTLIAPPEMAGNSALVQVFLMDGMQPIHSLMFSLNIEKEEGSQHD